MPRDERACCPMCGESLPLRTRRVGPLVVPAGASAAPYHGPGEVTRRSRLSAETVRGRQEVVQYVHLWEGGYSAPWAPFCSTTCAARFGLSAYRHVRGGTLPAEAVREVLPAPAAPKPPDLTTRYGLLLESAAEPEPAPEPRAEFGQALGRADRRAELPEHWRRAAAKYAEGTPGHPLWHPPGKPPPVPGEFRYDAGGYRISDTAEARESRAAVCAAMRERRAAKFAAEGKPYRTGRVNGHHHGPQA